jgi:hypothetical protein
MIIFPPKYRSKMPSVSTLGLVRWWTFDGGIAVDASGNRLIPGKNTTIGLVSGITPKVVGRQSTAFAFTDSSVSVTGSQVDLGNDSVLDNQAVASWSFWIYPNGPSNGYVMSRWSGSGTFTIQTQGTPTQLIMSSTNSVFANNVYTTSGSIGLPRNTWNHVVIIFNPSGTGFSTTAPWAAYFNGVLQSLTPNQTNAITTLGNGGGNIFLGYNSTAGVFSQLMNLGDVRIYLRALSAAEVLALYAEPYQPLIDVETIALGPTPPPVPIPPPGFWTEIQW